MSQWRNEEIKADCQEWWWFVTLFSFSVPRTMLAVSRQEKTETRFLDRFIDDKEHTRNSTSHGIPGKGCCEKRYRDRVYQRVFAAVLQLRMSSPMKQVGWYVPCLLSIQDSALLSHREHLKSNRTPVPNLIPDTTLTTSLQVWPKSDRSEISQLEAASMCKSFWPGLYTGKHCLASRKPFDLLDKRK